VKRARRGASQTSGRGGRYERTGAPFFERTAKSPRVSSLRSGTLRRSRRIQTHSRFAQTNSNARESPRRTFLRRRVKQKQPADLSAGLPTPHPDNVVYSHSIIYPSPRGRGYRERSERGVRAQTRTDVRVCSGETTLSLRPFLRSPCSFR